MDAVIADSFAGLVVLALERMAFVTTEPGAATAGETLAQSVAHAVIDVSGDDAYRICVSATPGMIREVAAGMMGLDETEIDVDDHGRATVAELANILGGELIMLLTSGDAQMALSLPQEADDELAGSCLDAAMHRGIRCVLGSDNGRLLVTVAQR